MMSPLRVRLLVQSVRDGLLRAFLLSDSTWKVGRLSVPLLQIKLRATVIFSRKSLTGVSRYLLSYQSFDGSRTVFGGRRIYSIEQYDNSVK